MRLCIDADFSMDQSALAGVAIELRSSVYRIYIHEISDSRCNYRDKYLGAPRNVEKRL